MAPIKNKSVIVTLLIAVLTMSSAPWWYPSVKAFLKQGWASYIVSSYDPSKILGESVFGIVHRTNQLPTDLEKQSFINDYSGLRTRREYASIVNTRPQNDSSLIVEIQSIEPYDDTQVRLLCRFDTKWSQKLKILGKTNIEFWGVVDRYSVEEGTVLLSKCDLIVRY